MPLSGVKAAFRTMISQGKTQKPFLEQATLHEHRNEKLLTALRLTLLQGAKRH